VQKHDTLRTVQTEVQDEDGIPMHIYAEKLAVTVPRRDFSTKVDPHEVAMAWMQQRFIEPFELTGQPLFRYDLVKISNDNYYWLLQYHHLIVDGYGVALLNRSLAKIYTQLANGQIPIWIAFLMSLLLTITVLMSNRQFLTNNANIGWINTPRRPNLYSIHAIVNITRIS